MLCIAHLEVKARGKHKLKRVRIGTTAPVGLFWAWGYIQLNYQYIGYPKPAGITTAPAPVPSQLSGEDKATGDGDDFSGHKQYEAGHSWRRIDWKAVSRGRPWLIKDFQGAQPEALVFDETKLEGDLETRLSQLSLWVQQAHSHNRTFSLRLGARIIPFGSTASHAVRCLEELGVYERKPKAS